MSKKTVDIILFYSIFLYFPLFRINETSFYIGVIFFIIYLLVKFQSPGIRLSTSNVIFFICLNAINLISFIFGNQYDLNQFIISTLQINLSLIFLVAVMEMDFNISRKNFLVALMLPIYVGLIFFFLGMDDVMLFGRFSGFFGNPNYLGIYIVVVLPIIIFCSTGVPLFFRLSLLIAPLLLSVVLSGSFSQVFLFMLFSLFSFGLVLWREKWRWFDLFQIIVTASLLVIFSFSVLNYLNSFDNLVSIDRFYNFLTGENGSLGSINERSVLNKLAIDEIINSNDLYFMGNGYGMSRYSIPTLDGENLSPHNFFLASILDVGFAGTLVYFLIIYTAFKNKINNAEGVIIFFAFVSSFFVTPYTYLLILIAPTVFYFSLMKRN